MTAVYGQGTLRASGRVHSLYHRKGNAIRARIHGVEHPQWFDATCVGSIVAEIVAPANADFRSRDVTMKHQSEIERVNESSLTPDRAVFLIVSFEGPDAYSTAGGLGVRVSGLAEALATGGYETHMFFIGDPDLPAEEWQLDGRLILHRWCQWLSALHPGGVYDGEKAKVDDLRASLPRFLARQVMKPIVDSGMIPVVLSEEWQTADCAIELSDELHRLGIRDRTLLFWNANNPYSFESIDWRRLAFTNTITTVSRYMRSIIRMRGADAVVIPNGIPVRLIRPEGSSAARLRARNRDRSIYFKMARWEREKGWSQALDALLALRERGRPATLVARSGGPTGAGSGLHSEASLRGLVSREVSSPAQLLECLDGSKESSVDVVDVRFGIRERLAAILYAASDGVLANSVSEPFGLVGLEAMAAGGAGEDYAVSGQNAVVLETLEAAEIVDRSAELRAAPERVRRMRRAARKTAYEYTWDRVANVLLRRTAIEAARRDL
jgi:glycosyltransferase involved in cell wall biosynthesis